LVLVWVRLSRTPWREIGYVRPSSWIGSVIVGIVCGVAFKFAMKAIVMPLLGAPPLNQAYHFLVGNRDALPGMLYAVIVGAGFGEETVFRGWMFERFRKLFGSSARATIFIALVTSLLFALAHYADQGLPGVEQAMITGLVFGTIFAVTGRIFTLMIAHAAFDLTAVCDNLLERRIRHGAPHLQIAISPESGESGIRVQFRKAGIKENIPIRIQSFSGETRDLNNWHVDGIAR